MQQLCEVRGCSPEDLPEAMNDREKWRERVRDIRASGTTWWWWWIVWKELCANECVQVRWKILSRNEVRWTRHAGHCWRSRDQLISDELLWTPHMAEQKQDDQQDEHTYSSYVRIRDVALKTCRRRWTIGRSGERGSRISVQAALHDDDDIVGTLLRRLEEPRKIDDSDQNQHKQYEDQDDKNN